MTRKHLLTTVLFLAFASFFTLLGYRLKETYEAKIRDWKEHIVLEAIASGEVIRSSTIRDSGLCKSTKYALK